jgi:hypothetical protein
MPMLAGNVVALLSPVVFVPLLTFALGADNYDYESMRLIRKSDDADIAAAADVDPELLRGQPSSSDNSIAEQENLTKSAKIARIITVVMTLSLLILWPFPMYGSGYVFSKKFFTGWVGVGIAWLFLSTMMVGIYPLWEGRKSMAHTAKSIYLDLTGKRGPMIQGRSAVVEADGDEVVKEKS